MTDRRQGPNIQMVLERLSGMDREFGDAVDRIEGKVDDLKGQAEKDLNEIKATMKVDADRISRLELWQARWEGARWALQWLPPLMSGIGVGLAVIVVGKLIGAG